MATGLGWTTRPGRVRRAAVRRADRDGRGARPCLIGGLVDCRSHRRREPGTGFWHHRPMRRGHVPRERENYPYQHGAGCRGEPCPTAGAEEPSRSRLSTHDTTPSHGNAAYQRAEQRGLASSELFLLSTFRVRRCGQPPLVLSQEVAPGCARLGQRGLVGPAGGVSAQVTMTTGDGTSAG